MTKHKFLTFLTGLCLTCIAAIPGTFAQPTLTDTLSSPSADSLSIILTDSSTADSVSAREPFIILDSLRYRFMGDGNFSRGNVNRTLMVLRAEIIYNGPVVTLTTSPRFTYGKQNGILAERDTYVDLFIDIYKNRRVYGFGLATIETSNLRGISLRQLAGAGAGFRLWRTPEQSISLTNAIIYESTDFRERPTVSTLRNSTRLKGVHTFLQNRLRITHITFLQPSLNDISNLRWNTLITLELPLNKWISIRSAFENSYESVVETTRKRNDSRFTFGISLGNKP